MSFHVLHLQLNLTIFAEFNSKSRQNFAFVYNVAFNQTYLVLLYVLIHVNNCLVAWIFKHILSSLYYIKANFGSFIQIIKINKDKKKDLNRWWPRNNLVWKWGDFAQGILSRRKQIEKKGKRECVHELMQHSNG